MTRTMSTCKSIAGCLLVTLVALMLPESPLAAQYTTANLGGTVADATGGTVPDARVTVRNTETGFTQATVSGAIGSVPSREKAMLMLAIEHRATTGGQ